MLTSKILWIVRHNLSRMSECFVPIPPEMFGTYLHMTFEWKIPVGLCERCIFHLVTKPDNKTFLKIR